MDTGRVSYVPQRHSLEILAERRKGAWQRQRSEDIFVAHDSECTFCDTSHCSYLIFNTGIHKTAIDMCSTIAVENPK